MQELPKNIPEHIRETMTITLGAMSIESEKLQLTIQEYIWQARRRGIDLAEIERALLSDLKNGGQLFGDFRKNFKAQMRYTVEEVARGEIYEEHKDVELWDWVAISDKLLCPDCGKRNGQTKTLDEWRSIGLPGAGRTICMRACRCMLSPVDSIQIPEGGIIRKKS